MANKTLIFGLLLVTSLSLGACSSSVERVHYSATLGEQLQDIKQAYDSGAITQEEYQDAKEILMDKYN